jgi:LysM repeat protein/ABC-type branched-subunit amino acid transport system substrate-binding protein
VPITVSKKKTVIDGKSYLLHTVKKGETLYSIGRAYNVLQKDIVFNNPDSFEGIRVGQELKIPEKAEATVAGNHPESAKFIYHITEKGQTAFSLAQTYNTTLAELYKHNPELEHSSLQAGQVVVIPKKQSAQAPEKPYYAMHEVRKRETLFSIAKEYDLDLNQVLEDNPEINPKDPKIKIGQEIRIRLPELAPIKIPIALSQTDTVIIREDLETSEAVNCVATTQKEFQIALLLPLFLADNFASLADTILKKDAEGRYHRKDGTYWIQPRSGDALEFYQGALLAIDSLKKRGLKAKIHVFDTTHDTVKMRQILNNPVMKTVDLIIGPFYTEHINQTARFAAANRIFYVSPITSNIASLQNNPYLLQINAGEINSVDPMVNFIGKRDSLRVVLIGNKAEADQTLFHAYRNKLKATFPDSLLFMHQFRTDSIVTPPQYLKSEKRNVVIITAANEGFINMLAAQLNAATHKYTINLYGLAIWTKFINLDPEYLHQLEFRYTTAYHIDYRRKDIVRFLQQYRKYYHTEPSMFNKQGGYYFSQFQYAFLGYDVLFFFGSAMQQYGKNFGHCIAQFRMPTLQSDFRFTKVLPLSGYINSNLSIYRYTKSYTVVQETQ